MKSVTEFIKNMKDRRKKILGRLTQSRNLSLIESNFYLDVEGERYLKLFENEEYFGINSNI
jgi:hypothetical protein